MKKAWLLIIALVVFAVTAWYLVSPAFRVIEVDEPLPAPVLEIEEPEVKDALAAMTQEEKAEFDEAVAAMADQVMIMDDIMPSGPSILSEGEFMKHFHEVEGVAHVIQSNGDLTLRFEDFETLNGPGLYIYLSSDLGDDDFVDLGKIKATKGNVNYEVPPGTDLEKYNKVLIWCRPFGVLFSYAELK